ncbi:MAG TPA: hypothetical protein VN429_10205 [Methanospirillum sp.]|uniref:hypothetical protein n=1 Tax=Methanospirillum sp. TaxID=45200 RepID=UPI002D05F548|nr:hypothetical protein [Methanospirillum sp.]HWQ64776.1 hypothetical protein [Methanospirillum sp.]
MDEDRRLRYQDKVFWIHGRADLIDTWLNESSNDKSSTDTKTVLALTRYLSSQLNRNNYFVR